MGRDDRRRLLRGRRRWGRHGSSRCRPVRRALRDGRHACAPRSHHRSPQAFGAPPTTGYADDPVNTSTGNFLETEVDLGFSGGTASLRFARTYNSLDERVGAFGRGWSSEAEQQLRLEDDGAALVLAEGREIVFPAWAMPGTEPTARTSGSRGSARASSSRPTTGAAGSSRPVGAGRRRAAVRAPG